MNSLKAEAAEVDSAIKGSIEPNTSSFEKKKKTGLLRRLWTAVNDADNRIGLRRFLFQGAPVPPSESIISQNASVVECMSDEISEIHNTELSISSTSHLSLCNILGSIVVSAHTLSAVSVKDASDSIVVLLCQGPVVVTNASNCHFLLLGHQIRLHELVNCTVWGKVASKRVVIEKCRNVQFGGFNEETRTLQTLDFDVDDFDWPTKKITSPNYTHLEANCPAMGKALPSFGEDTLKEFWGVFGGEKDPAKYGATPAK